MKPSSERKKRYDAPLHKKRKFANAHLSKELRKKEKKRSAVARKGDKAKVMRGKHKGKESKIARIDYKKGKVYLEGISKRTARGREMAVAFQPSNLMIIELTDRKEVKTVKKEIKTEVKKPEEEPVEKEEKKEVKKTEEKPEQKPEKEPVKKEENGKVDKPEKKLKGESNGKARTE